MSSLRWLRFAVVVALVTLAAAAPAPAATYVFRIHQPFMLGDVALPPGVLELRPVADHDLIAVTVNGRHLGVLAVQRTGFRPMGAEPALVLDRDSQGRYHLTDLRFASNASILHEDLHIEIAAVTRHGGPA